MVRSIFKKTILTAAAVALVAVVYTPGLSVAGSDDAAETTAVMKMETVKQNYLASARLEALRTHSESQATVGSPSLWLTRVDAKDVNMVTNKIDKGADTAVQVDGRSYNVNGEMGAWALKQNPTTRFAKDPLTANLVDKSKAATYADASGTVFYFESDTSLKGFLALGERTTAYGYSSPR